MRLAPVAFLLLLCCAPVTQVVVSSPPLTLEPVPAPLSVERLRPQWANPKTCEAAGVTFVFEGKVLGGCQRWADMAVDAMVMTDGIIDWAKVRGARIYVRATMDTFKCGEVEPVVGCTHFDETSRAPGVVCTDDTCVVMVTADGISVLHELYHWVGYHGHDHWDTLFARSNQSIRSVRYWGSEVTIRPLEGSMLDRDLEFHERWEWLGQRP